MKVKLETLLNGYPALERLASLYLSGKLNFRNSRTLDTATGLKKTFDEANLVILKAYGAKPAGNGWSFPNADKMEAYEAEIKPELEKEVEVYGERYELKSSSFDFSQLSGKQMMQLGWLVDFIDDAEEEEAKPAPKPAKANKQRTAK